MWALVLQGILATMKEVPELLELLNQMKDGGQSEPTKEQLDALSTAYTARTGADLRWDDFKPKVTRRRKPR